MKKIITKNINKIVGGYFILSSIGGIATIFIIKSLEEFKKYSPNNSPEITPTVFFSVLGISIVYGVIASFFLNKEKEKLNLIVGSILVTFWLSIVLYFYFYIMLLIWLSIQLFLLLLALKFNDR